MPTINAVQSRDVHSAIARASAATGVDFDYLLAQAKLESGLDPSARANTSSAAGLYQFISGTWLETLDRHGASHGMGWADQIISRDGGRASIGDPALRAQVMALRFDPDASALMAAELARDNTAELRGFLGREPDSAELYLAHFLGAAGARDFLGAVQADPTRSAAALFPRPAAANRAIFFDGGRARGVGEVMDLLRVKVAGAMQGDAGGWNAAAHLRPYMAAASHAPGSAGRAIEPPAAAPRPSMAETLRATFGDQDRLPGAAGRRVDEAYAKFRTFGV